MTLKRMINKKTLLVKALSVLSLVALTGTIQAQTVISGDANTSITAVGANMYDIATTRTMGLSNGDTASFYRFQQFIINAVDTYNFQMPGSSMAFGVVNNPATLPSQINGTINCPGNLMLVDPHGILVNAGATLNVGSLVLSTSGSTTVPLMPGAFTTADLNDPAQVGRLAQGIDLDGVYVFDSISGEVAISSNISYSPDATLFGAAGGVILIGNEININANITTRNPGMSNPGMFMALTGERIDFDMGAASPVNALTMTTPLAAGGQININNPANVVVNNGVALIKNNTNDIAGNIINISGFIDASAILANADAGTVILENTQGNIARITLNGAAGGGIIDANGNGNGSGGVISAATSMFDIVNNGEIRARNGATTTSGGTFTLNPSPENYTMTPTIRTTNAFITPVALNRIDLADAVSVPTATGTIIVFNNSAMDHLHVSDGFGPLDNTDLYLQTNNGNISIDTQASAVSTVVHSSGNLTVVGDNIFVDADFRSQNNMIMRSRTGLFTFPASSEIQSIAGDIILTRFNSNGDVTVTSDGDLNAGANNITIGNIPSGMFTNNIILNNTTWAGNTGTYSTPTNIDPASMPNVTAANVLIAASGIPPIPPTPPTPPTPDPSPSTGNNTNNHSDCSNCNDRTEEQAEESSVRITQAANSDAENHGEHYKEFTPLDDQADNANDSSSSYITIQLNGNNELEITKYTKEGDTIVREIELPKTIDICSNNRTISCTEFLDDSVGEFLVDYLLKGYPNTKEYEADKNGVIFAYSANYHPKGLQGFLVQMTHLEEKLKEVSKNNHSVTNNLMAYKHPPTSIRLKKVKEIISTKGMEGTNKKVKRRTYKRLLEILN